jgi:hypothetical protein
VDAVDRLRRRMAGRTVSLVAATVPLLALTLSCSGDSGDSRAPASSGPPAPTVPVSASPRWPSSIAGRQILDQHGDVYLMRSFASWSMAMNLTDAQITAALEGVVGRGFNAVTVWAGGGYSVGDGWDRYSTAQHGNWWNGTPWASGLGPGWKAMDRVMNEARRLGLTVNFSFCGGNGDTGARPDWEAATDEDMYDVGVAVARRYPVADYPNLVWHVMFDDAVSTTTSSRINALFEGINETEGAGARPVRWAEPTNFTSIYSQVISPGLMPQFRASMNGFYDNWFNSSAGQNSVELVEGSWREAGATTLPTGDTEAAYDGSPNIDVGDRGQQLRERSYAVFLEGGSYINYSHEDWWRFGARGVVNSTDDLEWQKVPDDVHTVQQQYAWGLLDHYVADPSWAPDGSFLTTGTGSGDTKAAAGRSENAAVAYFPSTRDVVVDTTVIAGTGPVRLRWYDPTSGDYTEITPTEAQRVNRSLTYPTPHADDTTDWVLVVDHPESARKAPSAPSAPRSLAAVGSNRTVRLTWSGPSSTGGARLTDYIAQRSTNRGRTWGTVRDGESTARRAAVGGLVNGQRYWFRVAAVTRAGRGPWSAGASAVPATTPSGPQKPAASAAHRRVRVTWLRPSSNGGAAISDYVVHRSADGGRTWKAIRDGVGTRRAVTVRGLASGQRYTFRIAGRNRVGRGAWSAIVRSTPR